MSGGDPQGRLFNPERFSPVHVSVWIHAPRGFGRTLGIATAVGRSIRRDSTFMPLRHGKDVIGVYIGPTQAHAVQKLAGFSMTSGYWRRFMEECEQRNIAHRCGDGVITFFIDHLQNPCPNPACGQEMYANPQPDSRYQEYRQDGTNSTGQAVPEVPATVPNSGDAYGMNRGMEGSRALTANVLGEAESNVAECLRCRRFGDDHVGSHISSWKEIGS